jgi:hypothetical protein
MTKTPTDLDREKRDAALEVLAKGIAMIHFDPRADGVVVPDRFRRQTDLRLNFAYGFQAPGFFIDDEGIGAVLSFGSERMRCFVPWTSVFAVTSPEFRGEGRVWSQCFPSDITPPSRSEQKPKGRGPARKRDRPALRVVDNADGAGESGEDEPPEPEGGGRPRPTLRVVK